MHRPSGAWCWLVDPLHMLIFNEVWILLAILISTALYSRIVYRVLQEKRAMEKMDNDEYVELAEVFFLS